MAAFSATDRKAKAGPVPLNGVDTPSLLATVNVLGAQPELARFQFSARTSWVAGTHSQSTIDAFYGAGGEHQHSTRHEANSDHPAPLCGRDAGPTPVEWALHALASCLIAGVANVAAARNVKLHRIEAKIEGDIDLRGTLGLSASVRNGCQRIRIFFRIEGDATREQLKQIVTQSKDRSAVFDMMANSVPIAIEVI